MKALKVRHPNSVHRGKVGEARVLQWCGNHIVLLPGTVAYKYVDDMSLDELDLEYSMSLFHRFLAGVSHEALWFNSYMHAVMWDGVCVIGLEQGVLFVLPNNDEVQKALLLGRGIVRKLFNTELAPFTEPTWRDQVVYDERTYCTPDPLHWVQHNF